MPCSTVSTSAINTSSLVYFRVWIICLRCWCLKAHSEFPWQVFLLRIIAESTLEIHEELYTFFVDSRMNLSVQVEWLENFTWVRLLKFYCSEGSHEVCILEEDIDKDAVTTNFVISWYGLKSFVIQRSKQIVCSGISLSLIRYDVQNSCI